MVSQTTPWFSFWEENTDENSLFEFKAGFKDSMDNVIIPPTFGIFTQARKVDHIVAVSEQVDNSIINYYLLKDKTVVGCDSAYIFDMAFDCESEGFIRFTDHRTEKAGMFNRHGEVVIPAEYALTSVMNGLIMALKDPVKKYWDDHNETGCHHWSWSGSMEVLMDTTGTILIENFDTRKELDLYSLQIGDYPSEKSYRVNYLGLNGKYYSFIDLEKYFMEIFLPIFLTDLSPESLIENTHSHAFFYTGPSSKWITVSGSEFIQHHYLKLKSRLEEFRDGSPDYFILKDSLGWTTEEWQEIYPDYFNNCGTLHFRNPIISICCTLDDGRQENYSFIKTTNGFKLISVNLW